MFGKTYVCAVSNRDREDARVHLNIKIFAVNIAGISFNKFYGGYVTMH